MDRPGLLSSTEAREAKRLTQSNEIQRNPTHRFSPKGSFAFSTKEARRRFLSRFNSLGALPSVASLLPQFSFSLQQVVTFNFFLRGTLDVVVGTAVYGRLRWPDGRTGADRDRALSDSAPVARARRRAHTPPCVTFCRAQHSSKILRIFTEIFKNFPTHICRNKERMLRNADDFGDHQRLLKI